MTRLGLKDELLDAQTLRAAGSAPYGGADIGECLAAAGRVHGTDLTGWHDAWASAAASALAVAEGALDAGQTESARLAFWRSSSYFRTAGVMLMGTPLDSRLVQSNVAQAEAFRRGAALLRSPRRSSGSRTRTPRCRVTSSGPRRGRNRGRRSS